MNKINTPRRNFSGKDILILVLLALLLGLSFYTQKIIRLSHQNLTEISKNDSTEL
jgi:phosphate/sulfate permease